MCSCCAHPSSPSAQSQSALHYVNFTKYRGFCEWAEERMGGQSSYVCEESDSTLKALECG